MTDQNYPDPTTVDSSVDSSQTQVCLPRCHLIRQNVERIALNPIIGEHRGKNTALTNTTLRKIIRSRSSIIIDIEHALTNE
ncbi:hypothetical protein BGAL_0529g00070 [Botrytis galanthina]|uniref:Uncharacterized protein n=1 Tax=Botrytis galanthina TaxID=278940 RepID=A0A4S8QMA6_9HELO|nr:hypothetical protein BGAL_0529g00070 [Botrytis galanthina]